MYIFQKTRRSNKLHYNQTYRINSKKSYDSNPHQCANYFHNLCRIRLYLLQFHRVITRYHSPTELNDAECEVHESDRSCSLNIIREIEETNVDFGPLTDEEK